MKIEDVVTPPAYDRDRLPLWARSYMDLLERRLVEALENEERLGRSQDPTDTFVAGFGVREDHGLPPGSRVRFRPAGLTGEHYLEARVEGDALVLRTDWDTLLITPRVQNRVDVRTAADRGR